MKYNNMQTIYVQVALLYIMTYCYIYITEFYEYIRNRMYFSKKSKSMLVNVDP